MTRLGHPMSRMGVQRLEQGERKVNADELTALARALDVPPLLLLFPIHAGVERTEVVKGVVMDTRDAMKWFTGQTTWEGEAPSREHTILRLLADHDRLVDDAGYAHAEVELWPASHDDPEKRVADRKLRLAVRDLRFVRATMRQLRMTPPPLDDQLAFIDDADTSHFATGDGAGTQWPVPLYVDRDDAGRVRPVNFSDRDD